MTKLNFKYLAKNARVKVERFGRAILLPVAIIPILGIFYAFGSFFSSLETKHHSEALLQLADAFKTIGKIALSNLDVLFAIGIAVGLAKRERPSAALAAIGGLIALYYSSYVILNVWHPSSITDGDGKVLGTAVKFGKTVYNFGVFGGIFAGLLAVWIHEKTYRIQFPTAFSFFGGTKFSPVAAILGIFSLGMILTFAWAGLNTGLSRIGSGLRSTKVFEAWFYGAFERLLIPFGLHQTLNNAVKWTDMGGALDVPTFTADGQFDSWNHVVGQLGIAQQKLGSSREMYENFLSNSWVDASGASQSALTGGELNAMVDRYFLVSVKDTPFYAGQFVTKGFGLVGAALAMAFAAPKEKRKQIGSLLFAAAFTSAFTGITEPIEFSFLFAAPLLYGAHILLTGLGFSIMYLTGVSGISLAGAGMFQWILFVGLNPSRFPNFWAIWIIGPAMLAIYFGSFYGLIKWKNLPTPGREGGAIKLATSKEARSKYGIKVNRLNTGNDTDSDDSLKKDKINHKMAKKFPLAAKIIKAHGGSENIISVANCVTRLRIEVKDKSKVDVQWLKSKASESLGFAWNVSQAQTIYGGKVMKIKAQVDDVLDLVES